MKKSTMLLILTILFVTGCKNSVPSCDDKGVQKLLETILEKKKIKLIKNAAITTINTGDKNCLCKSYMTIKDEDGDVEEHRMIYEINMADNGKEYTVSLKVDQ